VIARGQWSEGGEARSKTQEDEGCFEARGFLSEFGLGFFEEGFGFGFGGGDELFDVVGPVFQAVEGAGAENLPWK